MKVKPHKLAERWEFEERLASNRHNMDHAQNTLARGDGDAQMCHLTLLEASLQNGCLALILDRGDEEARRGFSQAVEHAIELLDATAKFMRAYHVEIEASKEGIRPLAIHEKVPSREQRLAVHYYYLALLTVGCFGEATAIARIAAYPEERYRSPNVIAGEDFYTNIRAYKAWLRGEHGLARKEGLAALKASHNARVRPEIAAFLAMTTGDQDGFLKHLDERLATHRKQYQRDDNAPEGVICQPGLMLCRWAIDRGLRAEDHPYLPLRFLPNYSSTMQASVD